MAEAVRPKTKSKKGKSKHKTKEPWLVNSKSSCETPKQVAEDGIEAIESQQLFQTGAIANTSKPLHEINEECVVKENYEHHNQSDFCVPSNLELQVPPEEERLQTIDVECLSANEAIQSSKLDSDFATTLEGAATAVQDANVVNAEHGSTAQRNDNVNQLSTCETENAESENFHQETVLRTEVVAEELLEQLQDCISYSVIDENISLQTESRNREHLAAAVQSESVHLEDGTGLRVYDELHQTLADLVLQENAIPTYLEATAPVENDQEAISETVYEENSIRRSDVMVKHRKIAAMASFEDDIRPFTENQIKALYYNSELEFNELFLQEFVAQNHHMDSSEFNELILGYLRSRTNLISTTTAIEELKQTYAFQSAHVWKDIEKVAKAQAQCRDDATVRGSHAYIKAIYDTNIEKKLRKTLSALQKIVHENYALHAYLSEMSKLQIESYLSQLIASSPTLADIPQNAVVQVYSPLMRSRDLSDHVEKMKHCISVLFSFQRRPVKDKQFLMDTRTWLTKLVALLLRVGSFEDHLFILNHILRCPAGVSRWAASYIQIPVPVEIQGPYCVGGSFLDHVITILATLLLPIRSRDEFLRAFQMELMSSSDSERENAAWVLVDSEGEEDEDPTNSWLHWCENDLVAFLNQIPFGALFRHILGVFTVNEIDYYDVVNTTDQEMLRKFSVATHLIYLLREGFKTFNLSRYRQLAKRISQLIRRIVMYMTGHLQQFMLMHNTSLPNVVQRRLEKEYDQFFLRAAYSIFSSQRLGAWQFMAAMPYTAVSEDMLWKILWLLHNDYEENLELIEQEFLTSNWRQQLHDQNFNLKFEERLIEMPENEAYYLLTAFANMAISRKRESQSLIDAICREIFEISFINDHTKTLCCKWGKELLGNIAAKHPSILSMLVKEIVEKISLIGKVSIFLFQGLPVDLWHPCGEDVQILAIWLREPPSSPENQLAQFIIGHLNWGVNENEERLFLDISIHRNLALFILDAYHMHVPIIKSFITESLQKAAASLGTVLSPVENFNSWCWETISVLKLHCHQMTPQVANSSNFKPIPVLHQDLALQNLKWDVKERKPLSVFLSYLMTSMGHSVAEVCKNVEPLQALLDVQCYEAALHILCHITPLFFSCGHYLFTHKIFLMCIQSLLNADSTYLKMAKNLIVKTFPGNILQSFSGMIEYQQQISEKMEWSKLDVFSFWFEVFTAFPLWYKNEGIIYLLDNMLKSTLFEAREAVISAFMAKFQNEFSHQGASNSFSSFINWMTTGSGIPFTLVSKPLGSRYIWFTYVMLEVETCNEQQCKMWKFVVKELVANPRATPNSAVRKASGGESLMAPPVTHLPIYRWAAHALEVPDDHYLAPLFWQKFFTFYLQRTNQKDGRSCGSVGLKFFEDMADLSFMKKIKKKLEGSAYYHRQLVDKVSTSMQRTQDLNGEAEYDPSIRSEKTLGLQHSREIFHERLTKLYKTFLLWLEESRLHDPNLYLPELLADFDPPRLLLVFESNQEPWLEFLYFEELKADACKLAAYWCSKVSQKRKNVYRALPTSSQCATDDMSHLLKSMRMYEDSLPAPRITPFMHIIPSIAPNMFSSERALMDVIMPYLNHLVDYARSCYQRFSHHVALDLGYIELLPQLYQNIETEVLLYVACHKGLPSSFTLGNESRCLGPAAIKLRFHEKKSISSAQSMLDQNRAEWLTLLNEALLGAPQQVCSAAVFIETAISCLLKSYAAEKANETSSNRATTLQDVGIGLFYYISGLLNTDIESFLPAKQFFSSCIDILGKEVVMNQGNQCERLLQLILESPVQVGCLAPYFCPNSADTPTFIKLYQKLCGLHRQQGAPLTFVILSKFDIGQWLVKSKPKFADRTKMVKIINDALIDFGSELADEFEVIHEVYRQHLCIFFLHQFPDMYRDVLLMLFKGVEEQNLSVKVWYDLLNEIVYKEIGTQLNISFSAVSTTDDIAVVCEQFALSQDLFTFNQIQDTLDNLGKWCMDQRKLSNETLCYTLYAKHKGYLKPIAIFLGILGHCYVQTMKRNTTYEMSPQTDIQKFWDTLKNSFSAWILPVVHDDKTYNPWLAGQEIEGTEVMTIFTSCVSFATKTFKDSCSILYHLLNLYDRSFTSTKEHVLQIVHQAFSTLSWSSFWPDLPSIQLMLNILNRGVPACRAFLLDIFTKISWPPVVNHVVQDGILETIVQTVSCLLHLHVGLGLEPWALQDESMSRLLNAAVAYPWHLIDEETFQGAMKRFLSSCDPLCVFVEENEQQATVLSLLQTASEFVPCANFMHPKAGEKRKIFIRSNIQLLCDCACKNKSLLNSRMELFKKVIFDLLSQVEAVLLTAPRQDRLFEEASCLVTEVCNILNIALLTLLQDIALKAIQDWVKAHPRSLVLGSCLYSVSRGLASLKHMAVLCETIIDAYFSVDVDPSVQFSGWGFVQTFLQVPQLSQQALVTECLQQGNFLTLNGIAGRLQASCHSSEEEWKVLLHIIDWLNKCNPQEENEYKIPLFWWKVLEGTVRLMGSHSSADAAEMLTNLSSSLYNFGEDRSSQGFFAAIGFGKKSSLSFKFRLFARALYAFVILQASRFDFQSSGSSADSEHNSLIYRQFQASLKILEQTKANKQYSSLKDHVQFGINFVQDSRRLLKDCKILLSYYVKNLFEDKPCLKILMLPEEELTLI